MSTVMLEGEKRERKASTEARKALKGNRTMKKRVLQIGDYVQYSAAFCRSIGARTGDIPRMEGHVKEVTEFVKGKYFARVLWTDGTEMKVLVNNLARVGKDYTA
jgi:hypothetical protein